MGAQPRGRTRGEAPRRPGHQVLSVAPNGVDWVFTAHSEGQVETYAQIVRPFGYIVAIDDGRRDVSPLKNKSIAWCRELMFTHPLQQTPEMIEQRRLFRLLLTFGP